MQSKYFKILICLVLVVAFSLAIATPSYAIPLPIVVGGAGLAIGGLAWAIANAMGVSFDMSNYTSQTIETSFDPWYTVQTTLNTSDFTFIKGLRTGYDALKLSLAAYNAIKAGAVNIITDNNIQDYSSGTIGNKEAFDVLIGVPFAEIDWTSPTVSTPDGGYFYIEGADQQYPTLHYVGGVFDTWGTGSRYKTNYPMSIRYIQNENGTLSMQYKYANGSTWITKGGTKVVPVVNSDLDYTSDYVNTSFGNTALDNITVIFPETSLPSIATLDDILAAINDLAIIGSQNVSVEADVMPPEPIPSDPLSDIPFDQFVDIYGGSVFEEIDNQTQVIDTLGQSVGQWIEEQTDVIDTYGQSIVEGIENQTDVIDTAGQSVVTAVENQTDVIDTVGQDVVEAVEAVDTNIQAGNGILSGIRSLIGSAVDTLENIGEMVGELVEDIVLGTETLISGILNQIPGLFNVILSPIKTASSIWHYVVEWVQSITGPFQFIWSMANGTSYYIVLPVYASLAAAVVLAFYKRFGK